MPIQFHPNPGEILLCDFPSEHQHGEMVKKRPVIILNRKIKGRPQLVNVVPISMTPPTEICEHHVEIGRMAMPKGLRDTVGARWAKCDMVYTLSINRLERVLGPRGRNGRRTSDTGSLPKAKLLEVRLATAACLGVRAESFASTLTSSGVSTSDLPYEVAVDEDARLWTTDADPIDIAATQT